MFIRSDNFQVFHSIEQLYFCNIKLVFKRELCQENARKMAQKLTKYNSKGDLSTSLHLSIAFPQAIILVPNENKFSWVKSHAT